MLLKLGSDVAPQKYTRWYTFWCCYGNMLSSSLLPLQNEILPFATQQGKIPGLS